MEPPLSSESPRQGHVVLVPGAQGLDAAGAEKLRGRFQRQEAMATIPTERRAGTPRETVEVESAGLLADPHRSRRCRLRCRSSGETSARMVRAAPTCPSL